MGVEGVNLLLQLLRVSPIIVAFQHGDILSAACRKNGRDIRPAANVLLMQQQP
jgi:hypothetical protein